MKIIGNTVGTTLPKANLDQKDPNKGDYIFGDRAALRGEKGDPGERGPAGPAGTDGATVQEVLDAIPEITGIDFSNFENGSFTETADGELISHSVSFDDSGRPVSIDDIAITWGS